jgi:hypothetical protein
MPGDPKQCRENALECIQLAHNAKLPEHKRLLTDLAQSWLNFAAEIERTKALLEADDGAPELMDGVGSQAGQDDQSPGVR